MGNQAFDPILQGSTGVFLKDHPNTAGGIIHLDFKTMIRSRFAFGFRFLFRIIIGLKKHILHGNLSFCARGAVKMGKRKAWAGGG